MIHIPSSIQKIIENEQYDVDNIGMSDSSVYLFADKVPKIQDTDDEADNEYLMMKWLSGKLLIPEILAYEKDNGRNIFDNCGFGGNSNDRNQIYANE